jgi:altronate hydrolase
VHTHNCGFAAFERDYAHAQDGRIEDILPVEQQATFQGFRRAKGNAGTRNYIGVVTSVNCSATVARFIAEEVMRSGVLKAIRMSMASFHWCTRRAAASMWMARPLKS